MFSALRKFFFIFLAILQLIAPLMHAHAGEKVSDLGLHVPGLEMYGVKHGALMSQAVNYDANSEGTIVGVDAGMKDGQDDAVVDSVNRALYLKPRYRLSILIFLRNRRSLFAGCLFPRYPLARLPLDKPSFNP